MLEFEALGTDGTWRTGEVKCGESCHIRTDSLLVIILANFGNTEPGLAITTGDRTRLNDVFTVLAPPGLEICTILRVGLPPTLAAVPLICERSTGVETFITVLFDFTVRGVITVAPVHRCNRQKTLKLATFYRINTFMKYLQSCAFFNSFFVSHKTFFILKSLEANILPSEHW